MGYAILPKIVNVFMPNTPPYPWSHELKYQDVSKSANETVPSDDNFYEAAFVYTKSLNLNDVVSLADVVWLKDHLKNHGYEVSYEFSLPEEYLDKASITNQNAFVEIDSDGNIRVSNQWLSGKAAVGRTPVVKVDAQVNREVISAYIKLLITDSEPPQPSQNIEINVGPSTFEYSELTEQTQMRMPESQINNEILERLGIPNMESLWSVYTQYSDLTTSEGVTVKMDSFFYISFDPYHIKTGDGVATVKLVSQAPAVYPDILINFKYNITHKSALPDFNSDYLLQYKTVVNGKEYETVRTKGKYKNSNWSMESEMRVFFENSLMNYENPGNHYGLEFSIVGCVDISGSINKYNYGAEQSSTDINASIYLTTPLSKYEQSRTYFVKVSSTMYNANICEKYFCIEFINPFYIHAKDVVLKTYAATPDQVDLSSMITIVDLNGKVIYENGQTTEYAKLNYGLTIDDLIISYSLNNNMGPEWYNPDYSPKLKIEGTMLKWYNGGNELSCNMITRYDATATIPYIGTMVSRGNITILSTNNSAQ